MKPHEIRVGPLNVPIAQVTAALIEVGHLQCPEKNRGMFAGEIDTATLNK